MHVGYRNQGRDRPPVVGGGPQGRRVQRPSEWRLADSIRSLAARSVTDDIPECDHAERDTEQPGSKVAHIKHLTVRECKMPASFSLADLSEHLLRLFEVSSDFRQRCGRPLIHFRSESVCLATAAGTCRKHLLDVAISIDHRLHVFAIEPIVAQLRQPLLDLTIRVIQLGRPSNAGARRSVGQLLLRFQMVFDRRLCKFFYVCTLRLLRRQVPELNRGHVGHCRSRDEVVVASRLSRTLRACDPEPDSHGKNSHVRECCAPASSHLASSALDDVGPGSDPCKLESAQGMSA